MTEIKLRDYQREAIDAVFAAWSGGMRRPAIVLPTGAGKTVVFSALVREFMGPGYPSRGPHPDIPGSNILQTARRVMILAHRDELVDQAIAKLRAVMPGVNVGKVKAEDNDIDADVMVCSVQTLAYQSRREALSLTSQRLYGPIGLIITDECHHAAAASYQKIYDAFPDALQLGVTATMARGDGVGLGKVWEEVVYKRSILNLISKGHLVDVRTKRVDLKSLDMGAVKVSKGDWASGDLGRALMDAQADTAIARAYQEHAGDRQGIVFTPTVETAHAATDALLDAGINADVIRGETPPEVRRWRYEEYRTGKLQVLVNCMVLTEGFDMPQAEVAVIARPTRSAPLYTQMVGRVLRPHPGKREALVLDLVGASANGLRTLIDLEPGNLQAPVRDGESLAEAVIREEEELNGTVSAGSLAFELKVRDIQSFASFSMAWLRTPAGVVFIACGDAVKIYLAPSKVTPGHWDVKVAQYGVAPGSQPPTLKWTYRGTEYNDLPLGVAMAWGEAVSEDYQPVGYGIARSAAWRKKWPSEAAQRLAHRYGISTENLRAGELADLIDTAKGAALFDRHVKG